MSFISAFFLAAFHLLALVWSTVHPDTKHHQEKPMFRSIVQDARENMRTSHNTVYAGMRSPDTGYWHTSGNMILDQRNAAVRIEGINWYGFETVRKVPGGLVSRDFRAILQTIKSSGFNTVRIPFSNEMIESPVVPEAISFNGPNGESINQPLRGLNSLQILDRIIEGAGQIGLKVILDNHRSEAGDSAQGSGLWYSAAFPERAWIADWQMLARRYAGNSTVIGMDLRNEPHNATSGGSCWSGCGAGHDWRTAAERAGNAVLSVNRRLIVFVEGTDAVNGDFYWWGGNLQGVRTAPVRLNVPNQLVYSAHEYGPKEYAQKWFNGASMASLEAVFTRQWAYISRQNIAPVWLGEFGTSNRTEDVTSTQSGSEGQWFLALTGFLGRNRTLNWTSWALNGEDSDGLLASDYSAPANPMKLAVLNRIMTGPAAVEMPQQSIAYAAPQNTPTYSQQTTTQAYAPQTVSAPAYTPVAQTYVAPASVSAARRASRPVAMRTETAMSYTPHLPASVLEPSAGNAYDKQMLHRTAKPKPVEADGL